MKEELVQYLPNRFRLFNTSISKKLGITFMFILIVAAANVVVVRAMLQDINGVAETINVAGKLRMLSQKIAFETTKVLREQGHGKVRVATAIDDFATALSALGHGGSAFGYNVKILSSRLQPQLEVTRMDWGSYRSHTVKALARASTAADFTNELVQITKDAERLLADAETLVRSLTEEAQQAQERALTEMYVLLLLDVIVLTAVFLATRRQIVHPLRALTQRSKEIAAGNYQAHIGFRSHDEIGQLADAFDHSAQRISNLIARINQDRLDLKQAELMFRGLAENSVVGVYIVQDGMFRFVNPKMAEIFAYERSEMISSVGIFDIVAKDDRHLVETSIQRRLNGEINEIQYECRAQRKDGSAFDVEVFGSKMELDGKAATIGIMLDITERKRVDLALQVLSACNQALFRATEESALLAEICRIMREVSGYPFVWIGYAEDDAAKRVKPAALAEAEEGVLISMISQVSWDDSETGKGVTGAAIRTGQAIVVKDMHTNAIYAPWRAFVAQHAILSAMSQPLKVDNKILGALTVYSQEADIFAVDEVRIAEELAANLAYGITALRADVARKRYAQQLEYQANYDVLTGLANRNLLSDRLQQAILSAHRSGRMVAVLLHDLDHFKVINDSLGHAAGDALLQAIAGRLRSTIRETDTVARLGGDEFVIVIPDMMTAEDAAAVSCKVLEALSQPFIIENHEMYISASIGISLYPQDGEHEEILLKNVDLAMYRAKHKGRGNFCFYTEEMNALNQERQAMESELHHALKLGEFLLHYQPKVDLRTSKVVGAEALIRWQHGERGIISPEKFIPLSEETGLILPIGAWAMKTACGQNRAWQDAGLLPISIAVNLSARQFRHHDLVGLVRQVLQETGLEPQYLELELTESLIMQEAEEAISTLQELKTLGVQLSLDDFGTGYSSLSYLRRFPLDNLKIDRSFVKGITSNSHDTTIVKTVIALAHSLNLKVIAEGVETEEQLAFLQAHDCDEMQGYLFSKPLLPEKLTGLLEAGVILGH